MLNRLSYPRSLIVDIHSYCNANCQICPYPQLHKKIDMGFMKWNLYKKIINDYGQMMKKYGFQGNLSYCQMGEPFILKEISKWVKYAIEKGIYVYFNTNASLLSQSLVDSLIDIGFNGRFNISFHGIYKDTYESIMGIDYDRTIRNIDYLLTKYPNQKITVNAIPFKWKPKEKKDLIHFWKKKDVKVTISRPLSRSGLSSKIKNVHRERIYGCQTERVLYQMVISFNGDVLLCCHDMARKVILGNLTNSNIEEIWNGKNFTNIINKIYFDSNLSNNFICKTCEESVPFWSFRRILKNILPSQVFHKLKKIGHSKWIVIDNQK